MRYRTGQRHNSIPAFFMLFLLTFALFHATASTAQQIKDRYFHIGIAGNPPFILADSRGARGIALEIWASIAAEERWQYKTTCFESVPEAIKALDQGKIDLVVGPVSITSDRVAVMDFSQPYYYTGLSIMSRTDPPTLWDRISPMFSMKLLIAVLVFLSILGTVGTLIWLTERERSPEQFPPDAPHGIANGMWLAIVTMSTTGYGDRAPITFWGRVICGAWMLISIIFATTMVAGIASTLTLTGMGASTITEADQLKGKKTACISEQTAMDFLHEYQAIAVNTSNIEEAYRLLADKKVDAIVFDRPQLLYFKQAHRGDEIQVSHAVYDPNGYGFAFPLGSPLVKQVNVKLLHLAENGRIDQIVKTWTGENK
ncbi:MAG TPA: transporter substrate-binding domain-containing protein [Edaphocola sp.]|nr:transporter substrate-binding domain-containing protein [Edaphocola sp.]